MITKALGGVLVYSLLIYATVIRGPQRDFFPLQISPPEAVHNIGIFLVLGICLWLVYDIIRYGVKLITLPLNWVSLGVLHIIINTIILYTMPSIFSILDTGVVLTMGSLVEVGLFTLGLGFVRSFI